MKFDSLVVNSFLRLLCSGGAGSAALELVPAAAGTVEALCLGWSWRDKLLIGAAAAALTQHCCCCNCPEWEQHDGQPNSP
jgi:hypothetical protein